MTIDAPTFATAISVRNVSKMHPLYSAPRDRLGLSRAEIDELYDDIAAFADIGQFIDQPVKLYFSGMTVRLAFAVQSFELKMGG